MTPQCGSWVRVWASVPPNGSLLGDSKEQQNTGTWDPSRTSIRKSAIIVIFISQALSFIGCLLCARHCARHSPCFSSSVLTTSLSAGRGYTGPWVLACRQYDPLTVTQLTSAGTEIQSRMAPVGCSHGPPALCSYLGAWASRNTAGSDPTCSGGND